MQCKMCNNTMRCYDDVCYDSLRIDFMICDKCKIKANVIFNSKNKIDKIEWIQKLVCFEEEPIEQK